jgi:hypothetical protein
VAMDCAFLAGFVIDSLEGEIDLDQSAQGTTANFLLPFQR